MKKNEDPNPQNQPGKPSAKKKKQDEPAYQPIPEPPPDYIEPVRNLRCDKFEKTRAGVVISFDGVPQTFNAAVGSVILALAEDTGTKSWGEWLVGWKQKDEVCERLEIEPGAFDSRLRRARESFDQLREIGESNLTRDLLEYCHRRKAFRFRAVAEGVANIPEDLIV